MQHTNLFSICGQDCRSISRSVRHPKENAMGQVGAGQGIHQHTQSKCSDPALLATDEATLRQRLRRMAIVQEIALRNNDRDTFTRAHRAWLAARQEMQDQFPADVQRIDDFQQAGVEVGLHSRPATQRPTVSRKSETCADRFEEQGQDRRSVA